MYVQIYAKSEDNPDSRGKTTWLNTGIGPLSIELHTTRPTHLRSPPWHIEIKAAGSRELNSGDRGGDMRINNYALEVALTPADLAALVNFAISNGLVEAVPKQSSRGQV